MRPATVPPAKRPRQPKPKQGRPSVGIRELKAKASAIVEDVKGRRITYAVTKRGKVEALIVPADAGERLLAQPETDCAWDAWGALAARLANEAGKKTKSALEELERMRR
jgi:antitoxin (DNA-binding transcriptional repressor) of toxin-antitoxin stability system